MTDLDKADTIIGSWLEATRLEAFEERIKVLRTMIVDGLVAERATLAENRSTLTAGEENELVQRLAMAEHELQQWRTGGVTEALLRGVPGGAIKVGKGCAIVRADEYDEMRAAWSAGGSAAAAAEREEFVALGAEALNARQVIREFMAYVDAGQVPEDAHCVRRARHLLATPLAEATSPAAPAHEQLRGLRDACNERIAEAIEAVDRAVAIAIERGDFEPRTALSAMSEVRARFAAISPLLDERLTIHRTETAAQAAVSKPKGGA